MTNAFLTIATSPSVLAAQGAKGSTGLYDILRAQLETFRSRFDDDQIVDGVDANLLRDKLVTSFPAATLPLRA